MIMRKKLRSRLFVFAVSAAAVWTAACRMSNPAGSSSNVSEESAYPPAPQPAQVIALGQVSEGQSASKTEQKLTLFFFGAEPEPGLGLIKPVSMACRADALLICDSALGSILRWDSSKLKLDAPRWNEPPMRPMVIRAAGNGDLLIVDVSQLAVLRYSEAGAMLRRYTIAEKTFRPAGVAELNHEVWVSDSIGHRILVFDAESTALLRTIGKRGPGRAEFGAPLGLAATPDGNVCVVDTLNNRVQLLNQQGEWIRDIGGPGNHVGRFGRPKDVAVGPDGTIFVTDAASQRVHAFDGDGHVLLSFGEPGSDIGALSMPAGICVCLHSPISNPQIPTGFEPSYFVIVAEQLRRPGIRVYAWRTRSSSERVALSANSYDSISVSPSNPHWSKQRCNACHEINGDRPQPIDPHTVDALCLSCHDGKKAVAEAHPIGRLASAAGKSPPSEWPLVDGRIACLTCHDIRRHCDPDVVRPGVNSALVRDFASDRRMDFCNHCHEGENLRRYNPHVQLAKSGAVNEQSCLICHVHEPAIPANGARRFSAELRSDGSATCLTCHGKHWDVSERGHVDRLASSKVKANIQQRQDHQAPGALPLWNNQVTCFSCHNPHQAGLFPTGSELGSIAAHSVDAQAYLRVDLIDLCSYCHAK